jgi:hypothetical protein
MTDVCISSRLVQIRTRTSLLSLCRSASPTDRAPPEDAKKEGEQNSDDGENHRPVQIPFHCSPPVCCAQPRNVLRLTECRVCFSFIAERAGNSGLGVTSTTECLASSMAGRGGRRVVPKFSVMCFGGSTAGSRGSTRPTSARNAAGFLFVIGRRQPGQREWQLFGGWRHVLGRAQLAAHVKRDLHRHIVGDDRHRGFAPAAI